MVDNDSNIIKPVESPQNIAGLTPIKRREERKSRQNLNKQDSGQAEQELNEPVDEQDASSEFTGNEENHHTIDYRA